MAQPNRPPTPPGPDTELPGRVHQSIKTGDPGLPSVQIRPTDKARFSAAAERAGLLMIDAMALAVELLDRATAAEHIETPAERIARIANTAIGAGS